MIVTIDDGARVLPLLALYAYAAFRLLPLTNGILWELSQLRYRTALVEHLVPDLERAAETGAVTKPSVSGTPVEALTAEAVMLTYAGAERPALSGVGLCARAGETIGIVGPTGAGKSTLADVLVGLLEPDRGEVRVDGLALDAIARTGRLRIGYVPQTVYLLDDTVRRNVAFGCADAEIDDDRLGAALRAAQLDEWIETLPAGLDSVVGDDGARVSGGERQRIGIARALYVEPEILVLDEATAALDAPTEARLLDALDARSPRGIRIVISHRVRTMNRCDRILVLADGRVTGEGSFEALVREHPGFRAMVAAARPDGESADPDAAWPARAG